MKPLLIGQAPGPRSDPADPLAGRCGARLAGLCGIEQTRFLELFERVNLLDKFPGKAGKGDRFDVNKARKKAIDLLLLGTMRDRRVVMLGANVARTFGFPPSEQLLWSMIDGGGFQVAFCPHPSGVSRWWNEKTNVAKALLFWRELAADAVPL